LTLLLALAGLLIGGLVNRLADQLPHRRPLHQPGACPSCGRAYDWGGFFALAAFPWRRGICPACASPLPLRPIVVEVAMASFIPLLWLQNGWSALLFVRSLYVAIFVLVTVTDLEHRRILNVVIYPAIGLALLASLLHIGHDLRAGLLGGLIGLLFFFLVFLLGEALLAAARRSGGGPALGAGDVKLATFIGIVAGWPGVVPALLLGIVLGGLGALVVLVMQWTQRTYKPLSSALPYGPFLAMGGLAIVLWGERIVRLWAL